MLDIEYSLHDALWSWSVAYALHDINLKKIFCGVESVDIIVTFDLFSCSFGKCRFYLFEGLQTSLVIECSGLFVKF